MELFKEIKDVKGFENYKVTCDGRVWSKLTNRWLIPSVTKDGYLRVKLCYGGNGTYKCKCVHRIVAETYIPNPDNLPQVNHKDENPKNNNVDNLEWCTSQYNNTYNDRHLKCAQKIKDANTKHSGKPIKQFTLSGELIALYPSTQEAARQTNFSRQGIVIACNGGQMKKGKWVKSNYYKNYLWKYA